MMKNKDIQIKRLQLGPFGTNANIIKSITEKIFVLPDDTQIYPSHGEHTIFAGTCSGFHPSLVS